MRRVDCMRPLRTWLPCMLVTVPMMAAESVLLLHGIARSPRHMQPLETALAQSGFEVVNIKYPSTEHSIEDLVECLKEISDRLPAQATPLHVVGYSLGGLCGRGSIAIDPSGLGVWCNWRRRTTAAKWLIFSSRTGSFVLFTGRRATGHPRGPAGTIRIGRLPARGAGGNRSDPFSSWLIPGRMRLSGTQYASLGDACPCCCLYRILASQ